MTDIDASEAPIGTRRRGSIENKEVEEDTNGSNLTAPDIAPDQLTTANSDDSEAPTPIDSPIESKESEPYSEPYRQPMKPIQAMKVLVNNKAVAHRRRNTDGGITFNPKTKLFNSASSNAAVIELMGKELPLSQRLLFQKKGQDLKLERELKHSQIKLKETQYQCDTLVEIIGKLEEEKEDLLSVNDTLRTQLGAECTEVKILEQKNKALKELYSSELTKYKEEVDTRVKQLSELTDDINQKDMALNQAKEYQKKLQEQLHEDEDEDDIINGNITKRTTKKEKQLLQALHNEQAKVLERNEKIEELMFQLETSMRAQHEKEGLQREIDSFAEMAQNDLLFQKEQMEKMQGEIITLAARNSSLEKQRDDLMQLLEERDYENQMLKTGYGLHRNKTTQMTASELNEFANQMTGGDEDFDDTLNTLEFMSSQPIDGDDVYDESAEYGDQRESISDSPIKKQEQKKVADVTREYLHLTASVVNMKFPRVQHISSEELINKVKNYSFWEYHDMMVRIMKTEEEKIKGKEKAELEQKQQANQSQNKNPGMLGRFRNFFGGGSGGVNNSRQRGKSATTREKRGGSATERKPPTIEEAKKKLKETHKKVQKNVKDLKNTTVEKITNKPSDEKSAKMADMEFHSVPALGGYHDIEKANKPKQGL